MRVGCLGMATLDTLLFVDEPIYDHDVVTPVETAVIAGGGKGIVCAVAMQRVGVDVLPFALVGARSELATMLPRKLRRDFLLPLLDIDSRTWITISGAHKVVTFVSRGALGDRKEAALAAVREFVSRVDVLYVTVEDPAVMRAALEVATSRNVTIALNPSLPLIEMLRRSDQALLYALASESSFIMCNDWEAPRFLDSLGAADWNQLRAPRLEEVVVTAGASGGSFARAPFDEWQTFPATPTDAVRCVVGAGDTFNGAYLTARLLDSRSQEESCRDAADLAAKKVAYCGSSLPL